MRERSVIAISRDGSYLILLSRPSADHAGLEHGIRSPLGICGADPILRINELSLSACDRDQEPSSEAQRDPVPPNKANQACPGAETTQPRDLLPWAGADREREPSATSSDASEKCALRAFLKAWTFRLASSCLN